MAARAGWPPTRPEAVRVRVGGFVRLLDMMVPR